VCIVAGAIALALLLRGGPNERAAVEGWAKAWERADWPAMRALLASEDQRTLTPEALAERFGEAARTATTVRLSTDEPRKQDDGRWRLPVTVRTRLFGEVRQAVHLEVVEEDGEARIRWRPELVFPGLASGEKLRRTTVMPERADILARDGTPLAQGADRTSPLGPAAAAIVGATGPIPAERRARAQALGWPDDAQVGLSGLERIFDERLAGRPGGELRAGVRLLARSEARKAPPVRTTIAPRVQQATVQALGGRLGGIVALRPRTGEVLAAAGIGFSGLQPPGSTFKIVTLAGALEHHVTKPSERFPHQTAATLSGVELQNANGESCGGTLTEAFAHSCNSVFGPLGVRLGDKRLVAIAEAFGFNRPPGIPGAATSSIPPAGEIGDDLAVGSTAIGQGRVQATALQMAIVAATIGLEGRRPEVTLDPTRWRGAAPTHKAISPATARLVERMMIAVVESGTGTAARIAGVSVAGKTGTAELRPTQARCTPDPSNPEACPPPSSDPSDTDAWFAAYAPTRGREPRVAVGVLLVGAGQGGQTAAPAARQVIEAALGR
jgi:cell division protein FtsI/penicillin-binding protein 2